MRCPMGWNAILRQHGYFMDGAVKKLKEHVPSKDEQGSDVLERPILKMEIWDDENESHPAGAVFYEFYVELVPNEWGLGKIGFPQKWCFTITEDLDLIVGATPLGYAHCKFPIDVLINMRAMDCMDGESRRSWSRSEYDGLARQHALLQCPSGP